MGLLLISKIAIRCAGPREARASASLARARRDHKGTVAAAETERSERLGRDRAHNCPLVRRIGKSAQRTYLLPKMTTPTASWFTIPPDR